MPEPAEKGKEVRSMPLIETKDLTYVYGENTPFQKVAVDHVNLKIEEGQFIGVIGHTGSGKSTLIQTLNGLLRPTSGQVLLDGKDIWEEPKKIRAVRFRVGMVFQYPEHQLFEETVLKDICFGPKNMGLTEEEAQKRAREAAKFVGLSPELLEKSPFDLSGGQKRRVAIAGVMAMRPRVLILDEPTAGLDPAGCAGVLKNITDYREATGSTVLLVTHSMDDAARIADRLIVFHEGTIAMDGTPDEVFSRQRELVDMGLDVPQSAAIADALRARGVQLPSSIYTSRRLREAVVALAKGVAPC